MQGPNMLSREWKKSLKFCTNGVTQLAWVLKAAVKPPVSQGY